MEFLCGRDAKNAHPVLPYMYFYVGVIYSATFDFTLYYPQEEGTVIFNRMADNIDNTLIHFLSVSVYICCDFNINYKECLVHAKTDKQITKQIKQIKNKTEKKQQNR